MSNSEFARARRPDPRLKTADFYQHVVAKYGPDFATSWLNSENCDFTEDTIFTTTVGHQRLTQTCEGIALKFGVRIAECPDVRRRFHARRSRL